MKVYGANIGPTWVLLAPGGPHVGLMNLAIWVLVFWVYTIATCFGSILSLIMYFDDYSYTKWHTLPLKQMSPLCVPHTKHMPGYQNTIINQLWQIKVPHHVTVVAICLVEELSQTARDIGSGFQSFAR